ncbi:MAG: dihydrolipoyl dehydrogenase [Pseudomonadota bacterium]
MASKAKKKDVVVIGGGPGGYVAAIRLGQLGKSVALIEKESLGGVCLNWGCIPSKALIQAAKLYSEIRAASDLGITVKGVTLDLKKTQAWKQEIIKKLTGGIAQLAKAAGVEVLKGTAEFETRNRIAVKGNETDAVEFDHAIVAVGSKPIEIPGFAIDGKSVFDSKDALDWTSAPKKLLVIGGGVIGLEIGMLFQKFGSDLTVVELTDQLVPGVDREIAQAMERVCRQKKIAVHLSSKALGYFKKKGGITVEVQTPKGKQEIPCDAILLAVGRRPDGTGLGLEKIGVEIAQGMIPVNSKLQTNVPHIYAIGDVAGPPLLAHKASKEGIVAAEAIAGHPVEYDVKAMPAATFTDPEIATVGLTESEAKAKGIEVITGKFPFAASGRAMAAKSTDGFVKVVAEKTTKLLLGVQIIGPFASDLIAEATLALELGATVEDLALTVHAHPTFSEAVMEAAEGALGRAIHMLNRSASPRGKETK